MGGPGAPRSPEEGAKTPAWLALLPEGDSRTAASTATSDPRTGSSRQRSGSSASRPPRRRRRGIPRAERRVRLGVGPRLRRVARLTARRFPRDRARWAGVGATGEGLAQGVVLSCRGRARPTVRSNASGATPFAPHAFASARGHCGLVVGAGALGASAFLRSSDDVEHGHAKEVQQPCALRMQATRSAARELRRGSSTESSFVAPPSLF